MKRIFLAAAVVLAASVQLALPGTSGASLIVGRNAQKPILQVDAQGHALVSYRSQDKDEHVLVWGAINALPPTRGREQTAFKVDYSGGWNALNKPGYYKTIKNVCRPYDGPELPWYVPGSGCKAPDGSYWALQAWQRMLPNFGVTPSAQQAVWELHLSHWTGPLPRLSVTMDWSWRRWEHLYGTFTYKSVPVHGFASTPAGVPLDTFGRNLYVDTLDSAYGPGWRRENSFLTHKNTGVFCYSINPHSPHPAGNGSRYRATIQGPGVTPLVIWEGVSPGAYDHEADLEHNRAIAALGDRLCRPN